jgi:hypothetical protein
VRIYRLEFVATASLKRTGQRMTPAHVGDLARYERTVGKTPPIDTFNAP